MTLDHARLAVIVEDDPDVRNLLRTVLTQSGFETILTSNGEDGVEAVRRYDPVLTTLDVSMPGMDGVAAASRIRAFSSTYILMITAQAEEIDVIQGLDAGADEYLIKPFRPRELRARIESLLRRPRAVRPDQPAPVAPAAARPEPVDDGVWRRPETAAYGEPSQPPQPYQPYEPYEPYEHSPAAPQHGYVPPAPQPVPPPYASQAAQPPAYAPVSAEAGVSTAGVDGAYAHRGLVLDPATGAVTADGHPVMLDPQELQLLKVLMSSGRRVRSKADLVLSARGESFVTTYFVREGDKREIDLQVEELRRKIGDATEPHRWIETVKGVGYRMTA